MGIDDKKATELFRQYGKRLYNTALRITLSSSEAEEDLTMNGRGCGGCA